MRLLMISGDRLASQGKQGAFWYTLKEMEKHWERIDVICPRIKNPKSEYSAFAKAMADGRNPKFDNVYFHPSSRGLLYQARWIKKKGKELIDEYHHDVMTVHEYPPFYNGTGAIKLSKKTGVPFILEIHHLVGWPFPASFSERIFRPFSRIKLPKEAQSAVAVRTVNDAVRSTLHEWGIPEEKIHTIPSFYLNADILKPIENISKEYDVVFAGRLVSNKGLDNLLGAMASLHGAKLLIIGDGPQKHYAQAMVKRFHISDRVTFTGWLPAHEDVIAALQKAKIFVLPSKSEGGPRIALEAMACGMPVLTTPVGVMPDVIRNSENGLLTTGDSADLSEKIALLLSDNEWRERMGQEARKILDQFERKELIANYAQFIKTFANEQSVSQ